MSRRLRLSRRVATVKQVRAQRGCREVALLLPMRSRRVTPSVCTWVIAARTAAGDQSLAATCPRLQGMVAASPSSRSMGLMLALPVVVEAVAELGQPVLLELRAALLVPTNTSLPTTVALALGLLPVQVVIRVVDPTALLVAARLAQQVALVVLVPRQGSQVVLVVTVALQDLQAALAVEVQPVVRVLLAPVVAVVAVADASIMGSLTSSAMAGLAAQEQQGLTVQPAPQVRAPLLVAQASALVRTAQATAQ